MGLSKVTYTDNVTVIGATNLNDIQDAIIDLEDNAGILELKALRSQFDGTKSTYNALMTEWFIDQGARTATASELTALVDTWYTYTRTGWNGWTRFVQPGADDDTGASTGTKGGDNADLTCTPSTNLVENTDDYAGLPQFAIRDCNWVMDSSGDIQITAIDGISSSFTRTDTSVYVGVLQMNMVHYWYEDNDTYTHGLTDNLYDYDYDNATPYPEGIKSDGTIRSWVCHGKYMASVVDSALTCCKGVIPTSTVSHNTVITYKNNNGSYYSGGTLADWSFLVLMSMIKYGSMTQDGINQGCVDYSYSYTCSVAESSVNRVILTTAQGANFLVGSTIDIGTTARSASNEHRVITNIEDVTIDGTTYSALNFDGDTVTTTTSTYVSTWHWITGVNDGVLGNDGSFSSASSGVAPAKIQGIEYSVGGYEVLTDTFMYLDGTNYNVWMTKDATAQASGATTSTSGYEEVGLTSPQPSSTGWVYISKLTCEDGYFFGGTSNGSSSTYTKDAFYKNNTSTQSATRALLWFGPLTAGVGAGGLSCGRGTSALSSASWSILARLSPNGNRGELSA